MTSYYLTLISALIIFIVGLGIIPIQLKAIINQPQSRTRISSLTTLALIQIIILLQALILASIIYIMLYILLAGLIIRRTFKLNKLDDINSLSLAEIIDQMPEHVYWKDLNYNVVGSNINNLKDFGFSSLEDLRKRQERAEISIEDLNRVHQFDKEVIATGMARIDEEIIHNDDGSKSIYLSHKIPLRNKAKQIVGVLGISVDVTNAKREIEERMHMLESIVSMMPEHVYWKDTKGVYLGCNTLQAQNLGFENHFEVVGKTDFDVSQNIEHAKIFIGNDLKVIKDGVSISVEENVTKLGIGQVLMLSHKSPLFNTQGEVVGIVGVSVDITERKKLERLEKERLEFESQSNRKLLEEQRMFTKVISQSLHDIGSPLTSLLTMASECVELPEARRITIRNAVDRINSISRGLLTRYKEKDLGLYYDNEDCQTIYLPLILKQLIMEKSYSARNQQIEFKDNFNEVGQFIFIRVQPSSFQRAISNLMNNAIDAMPDGGIIEISLEVELSKVTIQIKDQGCGMSKDLIKKLEKNEGVTQGKEHGNGIGITQVHDMLNRNFGKLKINSKIGRGTTVNLMFNRNSMPFYALDKIKLIEDAVVVVVDDDPSIHGAWDLRFDLIKSDYPQLIIHHFEQGQDAIKFINGLSKDDKDRVLLLTDYELLGQKFNGLDLVVQTQMLNSILVTSHFTNPDIIRRVDIMQIKLLPKDLTYSIEFKFVTKDQFIVPIQNPYLFILGEDFMAAQTFCHAISRSQDIRIYDNVKDILDGLLPISKATPIALGKAKLQANITAAKALNSHGYSQLYLIHTNQEELATLEIPEYVQVVSYDDFVAQMQTI